MAATIATTIRSSEPPTGVVEYTDTDGTGPYVLRGAFPGYSTALARFTDGQKLKYRVTNGVNQEVAFGTFDAANISITRGQIQDPPDGTPFVWGTDRKIIYIEISNEFDILADDDGGTGTGFTLPPGFDGQVLNSLGGFDIEFGQRIIGMAGQNPDDVGENVTITGGLGNQNGDGGEVNITGGMTGNNGFNAGDINITGGAAFTGSGAAGGDINIITGLSDSDTGGQIGNLTLATPNATGENQTPGGVVIQGGDSYTGSVAFRAQGGTIDLRTGKGSEEGDGGDFHITTGGSLADDGSSGYIFITSGEDSPNTSGGVIVSSGTPDDGIGSNADAGDIIISSGRPWAPSPYLTDDLFDAQGRVWILAYNDVIIGSQTGIVAFSSGSSVTLPSTTVRGTTNLVTTGGSASFASDHSVMVLDGASSTFTVTLPSAPVDGQEVRISSSTAVGTLTISAPGKTIKNPPASLAAGVVIGYKYSASNTSWYRI